MAVLLLTRTMAAASEPVEVIVEGLGGDRLANVRTALTLPYGLIENGAVNELWLKRFNDEIPETVRTALMPFGYYRSEVRSTIEKTGKNRYRITVRVRTGEPVRVSEVKVAVLGPGSGERQLKALAGHFPLHEKDVLLQKKYEEAKAAIRSRAVELGYLDADYGVHRIEIDPEQNSARIELELETGRQYRFDGLRFEGARRYPETFLHRFVTFKPGDIFSYSKLAETQRSLIDSDRFKEVLPVAEKSAAAGNEIPVSIRLEEAPSRRLRPGVGYASDVGPRLSAEYRDLNVFDRGYEFHSELGLSYRLQTLGAGFVLPDARDANSSTDLKVNYRREAVATYVTRVVSAETDRNRKFSRGRAGAVYLKLEREDSTIGGEPVRSRLVLPGVRFSERRVDSLVRPSRGHNVSVDVHGTHEALGSNSRFAQIVGEGDLLIPLPQRMTLLTRLRIGATFQNDPFSEIPVSVRFFAGGDRSVRGYAYQSLGPRDDAGNVVGGRDLLVGSIELDRALFTNWGAAVFYDAGNAFNSFQDVRLFEGAGIGVRYYTVVGALRLDVARQINVPQPGYRLHFTVGIAF